METAKLTARKILNEGFSLVTQNFWQVISIGFFPIIFSYLFLIFWPALSTQGPWDFWIETTIELFLTVFFSVQWLRFIQTGQRHKGVTAFRFCGREWRFLFAFVFLWLLPYLIILYFVDAKYEVNSLLLLNADQLYTFIFHGEWWWTALLIYYCFALRWLLIFPGLASGEPFQLSLSWRRTKGKDRLLVRSILWYMIWFYIITYGMITLFNTLVLGWEMLSEPVDALAPLHLINHGYTFSTYLQNFLAVVIKYCFWAWALVNLTTKPNGLISQREETNQACRV